MDTVLLYIVGILIIVVGLALSIGLHELGHLIPAKLFGVRVGQYMIGFGPTLFSRKRGETEYGLKAIPLGGYISMAGMYPPMKEGAHGRNGWFQAIVQDARDASAGTILPGEDARSFYRLAVWKRIIVMLGGPFMNLVIALVLYTVILCGLGIPQLSTTIGSVNQCVVPATISRTTCTSTDEPSAGARAGLKPGDKIVSIDGTSITSWDQATKILRSSADKTLAFVVERGSNALTLSVTPRLTPRPVLDSSGNAVKNADGTTQLTNVGFVGIGPGLIIVQQPITAVLPTVGANIAGVAGIIVNLPAKLGGIVNSLFTTAPRDPTGPISVVGVGRIAGEIASVNSSSLQDRATILIGIVAQLNVALLVFNLVPLMPLDGGHVAVALWEALRRGFAWVFKRRTPAPPDTAKLVPLTFVITVILVGMSALLIVADFIKPVTIN